MSAEIVSAYSSQTDTAAGARELVEQLGAVDARVISFFHSPNHDGNVIVEALKARFPNAQIVGASTCGEFSDRGWGQGGLTALALSGAKVEKAASAFVSVDGDLDANVRAAAQELSAQLGADLRELDPTQHVGLLLVDSSRMREEAVNEALGNVCPLLSFVGGSAGDGMKFQQTFVYGAGRSGVGAASLLVMKLKVPFHVLKACNFEPGEKRFTVTRADPAKRIVYELDGKPAAQVYGEAIGAPPDQIDVKVALFHPLGLMIDGKPWLRSVIRSVDGGLLFACSVREGMELEMMKNRDIVADTRQALDAAEQTLGGKVSGGLMFNCVARMVEVQVKQVEAPYYQALSRFPAAGFHAHGESWLGHINQTLTGLLFA